MRTFDRHDLPPVMESDDDLYKHAQLNRDRKADEDPIIPVVQISPAVWGVIQAQVQYLGDATFESYENLFRHKPGEDPSRKVITHVDGRPFENYELVATFEELQALGKIAREPNKDGSFTATPPWRGERPGIPPIPLGYGSDFKPTKRGRFFGELHDKLATRGNHYTELANSAGSALTLSGPRERRQQRKETTARESQLRAEQAAERAWAGQRLAKVVLKREQIEIDIARASRVPGAISTQKSTQIREMLYQQPDIEKMVAGGYSEKNDPYKDLRNNPLYARLFNRGGLEALHRRIEEESRPLIQAQLTRINRERHGRGEAPLDKLPTEEENHIVGPISYRLTNEYGGRELPARVIHALTTTRRYIAYMAEQEQKKTTPEQRRAQQEQDRIRQEIEKPENAPYFDPDWLKELDEKVIGPEIKTLEGQERGKYSGHTIMPPKAKAAMDAKLQARRLELIAGALGDPEDAKNSYLLKAIDAARRRIISPNPGGGRQQGPRTQGPRNRGSGTGRP